MQTIPYKHLCVRFEKGSEAEFERLKNMLESYIGSVEQYIKQHPNAQKEAIPVQIDAAPEHPQFLSVIYRNDELYMGIVRTQDGQIKIKNDCSIEELTGLNQYSLARLCLRAENAEKALNAGIDNHKLTKAWENHIDKDIVKEEWRTSQKQGYDPEKAKRKITEILHKLANKDFSSYLHSIRVANLVKEYCERMGIPEHIVTEYTYGGMLHDIGKTEIDDSILKKAGKLTADELPQMQSHVLNGLAKLDENLKTSYIISNMIQHHHEAFAGTHGYPDKSMHGHNIPLCARIASVCDVYDALSSKRPYKEPFSQDKVIMIMKNDEKLDPAIVEKFIEIIKEKEIVKHTNKGKSEKEKDITHANVEISGSLKTVKAVKEFNRQNMEKLESALSKIDVNRAQIEKQAKEFTMRQEKSH